MALIFSPSASRNITVFSAHMAALTIDHGSEKKSAGPDLLLSYHDNDHYNSVRDNSNPRPPPPIRTWSKLEEESPEDVSQQERLVATGKPDPPARNFGRVSSNADSTALSTDDEPPRMVKKSSPCPCGSGKRYKHCCWAKEKHAARIEKLGRGEEERVEEQSHEMDGNFRVLKI